MSKKTVGFLDMPPELRNHIYQMLLTTEYAFKKAPFITAHETHYELTPGILGVNKQIYCEAWPILYHGNLWIILHANERIIGTPGERGRYLPKVCTNPTSKLIVQPALYIKLDFLPSWQKKELAYVVIGAESIEYLIDCLWSKKLPVTNQGISDHLSRVYISLTLMGSKMYSMQQLQECLVKPFFNVHGCGRFIVKGAVKHQSSQHPYLQLVALKPSRKELLTVGQGFLDKGDAAFAEDLFDDACYSYHRARKFIMHVPLKPAPASSREDKYLRNSITFSSLSRLAKAFLAMKLCQEAHTLLRCAFKIPRGQLPSHAPATERARWHLLCAFTGMALGDTELYRVIGGSDSSLLEPRSDHARNIAEGPTLRPIEDPTRNYARNMAANDFFNAEWLATSDPAPIIIEFHEIKKRVEAFGLWKVDDKFDRTWSETFSWSNERFKPRQP